MNPTKDPHVLASGLAQDLVRNRLRAATDDELLDIYADQRANEPELAAFLPKLPSEAIQSQFTGATRRDTFLQAIAFLRTIRDFAEKNGHDFGTPSQRILDFGCGWGRIIQVLQPFFDDDAVYGVDVMPAALVICRETGIRAHLDQVYPWPPGKYPNEFLDYIVSFSVFSHLSEDNAFAWIREFARILKPGGIVAITTRPRDFILYVKQLREQVDRPSFSGGAAKSFMDTEAVLAAYDRGEFCFDPEGKGGPGLTPTYGETAIPMDYVRKTYSEFFSKVDFSPPDYTRRLDQVTIFLIK